MTTVQVREGARVDPERVVDGCQSWQLLGARRITDLGIALGLTVAVSILGVIAIATHESSARTARTGKIKSEQMLTEANEVAVLELQIVSNR